MPSAATSQNRSRRRIWRAFWLLGLICHLPLTLRAISTIWAADSLAIDWAKLLALTACNAFFLLEITLSPCLRFVPNRRTAVAMLLVIAVLHAGVIEQQAPGLLSLRGPTAWLLLTALGAATIAQWLRRNSQRFLAVVDSSVPQYRKWLFLHGTLSHTDVRPPPLLSTWRIMPLRAPPFC